MTSMPKTLALMLLIFLMLNVVSLPAQDLEAPESAVVRITCDTYEGRKTGSGFIVNLTSDVAFILTAAHVVEGDKHPKVEFFTRKNVWIPATVLTLEGGDPRGLASLVVKGEENLPPGLTALSLAQSSRLAIQDEVIVVGVPQLTESWSVIKADYVSRTGRDIHISGPIDEGLSGGPVIRKGQVVGLARGLKGPFGIVIPVESLSLFLEGLEIEVSRAPEAERPIEPDKRTNVYATGWITFMISGVDYLPPISDGWGQPDFFLIGTADNGVTLFRREIFVGGRMTTQALEISKLSGAKDIEINLIESDAFGHEQITNIVEIGKDDLFKGKKITLRILNSVFTTYPSIDRNKKWMTLNLKANSFDPEQNSGIDKSIDSPLKINPGALTKGSVDFNKRDATDYILIPTTDGTCVSLFWARSSSDHYFDLVKPKGDASLVILLEEAPPHQPKEVLAVTERSDGAPLILRVHAERPPIRTDYNIFSFPYADRSRSVGQFVMAWLEREATRGSNLKGTWSDLNTTNGIEAIRKHFNIPFQTLLVFIEEFLKKGSHPGATIAMGIFEKELDQYARAVEMQRHSLKITPLIVAVLLAENGKLTDRSDLTRALHDGNGQILLRAIGAVGKLGDQDYAKEVLTEFLLDERMDISEAAKKVLRSFRSQPGEQ
jgi:S1-C subfamily serine protease